MTVAGRNSQISRIYCILDILEGAPQGLSAAEIAIRVNDRGHEVGKRTVYRDLQALNAAGFPLHERGQTEDKGTRWALDKTTRITDYLTLSSRELIALYLARSSLVPLRDTPFFNDLEQAFAKIEEKIGKRSRDFFQGLEGEFRFEAAPKWGLGVDPDVVETIRAGCSERQVLSITYKSTNSGRCDARLVGPQYLYFAKGSLYFVAEDLGDSIVKVFSVPRIQAAAMTEQEYAKDPVDPEEFFGNSFGVFRGAVPVVVKLKVQSPLATYLKERQWHSSQRVVTNQDGSIEMTFDVALTPDLEQWILGFGAKVEVVEPAELRRKVADAARGVVGLYRAS